MLFCKNCGQQVEKSDRFCTSCMSRLDQDGAVIEKREYSRRAADKERFDPDGVITETDLTGFEITGYRLTEKIGSFAGSIYYRAVRPDKKGVQGNLIRHTIFPDETSGDYALLMHSMSREAADAAAERFVNEIKDEHMRFRANCLAAGLQDLNYDCTVYFSPLYGKSHIFIMMREAIPLTLYTQINPLTLRKALQIGVDICSKLLTLNKHDISYGAFSDDMIFVDEQGTVFLDFCAAKHFGNYFPFGAQYQHYRMFCSPYQANSEIYSLGMVLYYLISGFKNPYINPYINGITGDDLMEAERKRIAMQEPFVPEVLQNTLGSVIVDAISHTDRHTSLEEFGRVISNALNYLSPAELNNTVGQ